MKPALCEVCRDIDFQQVLHHDAASNAAAAGTQGTLIAKLGYLFGPHYQCPLCDIFRYQVQIFTPEDYCKSYELRAHSLLRYSGAVHFHDEDKPFSDQMNALDQCFLMVTRTEDVQHNISDSKRLPYFGNKAWMCVIPKEEPARLFRPSQLQPMVDFGYIIEGLQDCKRNHGPNCQAEKDQLPGLKVIDCDTRSVQQAPPECLYACLSYAWGPEETSSNLFEMPKELTGSLALPERLPRTIEDAISVTRNLGLRYLWIDKYCIPQQDLAEKQRQINQMDLVYSAAEITIVAAAGRSQQHGLPGATKGRRDNAPSCTVKDLQICYYPALSDRLFKNSHWNSRGWTFQELVLSRRCLVFTDEQAVLECSTRTYWEALRLDLRVLKNWQGQSFDILRLSEGTTGQKDLTGPAYQPRAGSDWFFNLHMLANLMTKYCCRELTFDRDALNAFAGISREFAQGRPPLPQVSGVPFLSRIDADNPGASSLRHNLFVAVLLWRCEWAKRRSGAPSWSCMGWRAEGLFWTGRKYKVTSRCATIDFQYDDGSIISLDSIPTGRPLILCLRCSSILRTNFIDTAAFGCCYLHDSGAPHEEPLHLLGVKIQSGVWELILIATDESDNQHAKGFGIVLEADGGYWVRVGTVELLDTDNLKLGEQRLYKLK